MYKKQEKKTICFLFGAGAEISYGLPSGAKFKQEVLCSADVQSVFSVTNPLCDAEFKRYLPKTLLDHRSTSVLFQSYMENKEDCKPFLTKKEVHLIENYCKQKNSPSSNINKELKAKFFKLYQKRIYKPLKNGDIKNDGLINEISFYSFIDSLFNHLRFPRLYVKECARVMALYFSCFAVIFRALIGAKDNGSFTLPANRTGIVALIQQKEAELSNREETYYRQIRDSFNDDASSIRVITSNYSRIAQRAIGLDDECISYVHGRLDMFESLKTKEVRPLDQFKDEEVVFPFLFAQSGVKPVVSPFQIEELSKALKFATTCWQFVVLGYGINNDDDHLNSILLERLKRGLHIIFVVYDGEGNRWAIDERKIKEKFKEYEGRFTIRATSEFANIIGSLRTDANYENISDD